MNNLLKISLCALIALGGTVNANAQRKFKHPGLRYTQADIDRMRAMVEAKQEPFYSGFIALRDSNFYTRYRDYDRPLPTTSTGEPVIWDNPGQWLDNFGKIAFNNALLYKLTDDRTYADKAVVVLNHYAPVHSVKPYGTNPLDASKIHLLLEAAELLRDYDGWKAEDQQGFKDFLVYPGYSTTENYYDKYASSDTLTNKVTIYWNIFQGDPARHGNQGLYAMRALLAMGIYLDNDTIYDRALRKTLSQKHRPYDLAYPKGPNLTPYNPSTQTEYFESWRLDGTGDEEDYGADDELKYWIYENGQCQESSRDQGHILDGLCGMMQMARMAWNQGDDLYTQYDDRLLKGINYTAKYVYSWLNNHTYNGVYWTEDDWEPTVENGQFLKVRSHNNRFRSLKINPWDENYTVSGPNTWSRGKHFFAPTQILMPYKIFLGRPADSILWAQRAYDVEMDLLRQSGSYSDENMTDYRTAWMAGDAGTFTDGRHVSGLHKVPGTLQAADYDYFNDSVCGLARTYYNSVPRADNGIYRSEGGMTIATDEADGLPMVTGMKRGAWMNYTLWVTETGTYEVKAHAKVSSGDATMAFAVDNTTPDYVALTASAEASEQSLGKVRLQAGARVLRIYVDGADDAVSLKAITLTKTENDGKATAYEWNSQDYTSTEGGGTIRNDQGADNLYTISYASKSQPVFTLASEEMNYSVSREANYLAVSGDNLDYAVMKSATYKLDASLADVTKSSSSGQANHHAYTTADGQKLLVWKLDSATSKRVKPLLQECYTSDEAEWLLRQLTFNVYGTSVYKHTTIRGIHFLTVSQLAALYPETTAIREVKAAALSDKESVYDLQGRKVTTLHKGNVYLQGGKKVMVK